MKLDATGERLIVDDYMSSVEDYVIYLMHIASYKWAEPFVRGKRVLDFGCGSGYGAAELAKSALSVQAVDVSKEAVEYAMATFNRDNLRFDAFDPVVGLPFADGSFDVVVSFQVIEHVSDMDHYIAAAHRILAPGGQLLLITPNRCHRLFPWQKPWNRWHIEELDGAGLESLLNRHFQSVEILGMSGDECFTKPEIDRCRKLKWMSLPFTLPFYPDAMRVRLLNVVHRLLGRGRSPKRQLSFAFDDKAVQIGLGLQPSLNLVASARR